MMTMTADYSLNPAVTRMTAHIRRRRVKSPVVSRAGLRPCPRRLSDRRADDRMAADYSETACA